MSIRSLIVAHCNVVSDGRVEQENILGYVGDPAAPQMSVAGIDADPVDQQSPSVGSSKPIRRSTRVDFPAPVGPPIPIRRALRNGEVNVAEDIAISLGIAVGRILQLHAFAGMASNPSSVRAL